MRSRLFVILCTLAFASVAAFLFVCDPQQTRGMPHCPFHELTGWNCPGCGTLRGLHALLHGQVGRAFAFNPLMVITLPGLGWTMTRRGREMWNHRVVPAFSSLKPATIYAMGVLLILYWIGRNLAGI